MEEGGGGGNLERERTFLFSLNNAFCVPFHVGVHACNVGSKRRTFQISCALLAKQIPHHCNLLMPIQEECVCDFCFQYVDLLWYITAQGSDIKWSEQQLYSLALQPSEVESSTIALLCPGSICIFSFLLYLPWGLLKQDDLPEKNEVTFWNNSCINSPLNYSQTSINSHISTIKLPLYNGLLT